MMEMKQGRAVLLALAAALAATTARVEAVYLDDAQNVSLRARIYSQAGIRIEDSSTDTVPTTKTGQLVQHRNFFNPELDVKLGSYLSFLRGGVADWLAADDFRFRLAAWGFYDGVYDYGASQFDRARQHINSSYPDVTKRKSAFFLEGSRYDPKAGDLRGMFPDHEPLNPRAIFAKQRRINELYLSYSKGPVFVRIGRQGISWGESDTIALLDQNNPFDVTLGAPGIFQDLDESRIPLWTIRTSYKLFDVFGPVSSAFVEGYWVPGELDTNTGWFPILGASPYSPRGADPQTAVPAFVPVQIVTLDRVPEEKMSNSRWGVRLQALLNRTYTVSGWYYTHFPNQPVPLARGSALSNTGVLIASVETVHELTSVVGAASTFFFEPLDGIVRLEAEYFDNEPGFIPEQNFAAMNQLLTPGWCAPNAQGYTPCRVPKADFLRWEVGFDRFFFLRALNPTNSFTLVTAVVGSYNLDETGRQDFRFAGQLKPGKRKPMRVPIPDDYVQLKKVEGFLQTALQTEYFHGRVTPRLTTIFHSRGTYAILPSVRLRWADWLLFEVSVIHIGGDYQSFGFFRDRDQASARVTYQLN